MNNNNKIKTKGYIAFTTILIVSAVTLIVSTSIALIAVTAAQSSLSASKSQEVMTAGWGCVEEALLRLRNNAGYLGEITTIGISSCQITVTGTNPNFTINVVSSLNLPPIYSHSFRLTVKRAKYSINLQNVEQLN